MRGSADVEILNLVGNVYKAASEPEVWPGVLRQLSRAVGASVMALVAHQRPSGRGLIEQSVGLDPAMAKDYEAYYSTRNIWALSRRVRAGVVLTGEELVDDRTLLGSEFYNDHLRPYDYRFSIGTTLIEDPQLTAFLAVGRPHGTEPFGDVEKETLELLVPHLQNAVHLRNRLESLRAHSASSSEILDRLDVGVVLLGRTGATLLANAAAREIAAARDGLAIGATGVRAARPADTATLARLIAAATGDGEPERRRGGSCTLWRPSGARPYSVLVAPLSSGSAYPGADGAAAVLFISDPGRRIRTPAIVLKETYGLTPAEARLAERIAQGQSLRTAAGELAITIHTARSQIKSIFAKTGVSRQAELVHLLLAATGWLRKS